MDSPIAERTRSKLKRKAQESKNIPLKRTRFFESYRHQRFALPDSVMHHIANNPSSPEVYQKLTSSCKYFFVQNSILILSSLYYSNNRWKTWINGGWKDVVLNNVSSKIWITGSFYVWPINFGDRNIVSSFISKISYFNVYSLSLQDQTISLDELMLLSSHVGRFELHKCNVMTQDGSVAALEKIVENLPKVKNIVLFCTPTASGISNKTFDELLKIPQFLALDFLTICDIPEEFDLEKFYIYMKKNKTTDIFLLFVDTVSNAYKTRLESIVDEIIETEEHAYKPPYIRFDGLNREKLGKLRQIIRQR